MDISRGSQSFVTRPKAPTGAGRAGKARRRFAAPLGLVAPALVVVFLLVSPPALAYDLLLGGFADGSDSALVSFDPLTTEMQGPSLRLYTNATVSSGSVVIAGTQAFVSTTTEETSSADFFSNSRADGVAVANGTVSLAGVSTVVTLELSNTFRNVSQNGTALLGSGLVLNGVVAGTAVSENLSAPTGGWGTLLVSASLPVGTAVAVDLLLPNSTVAVSNQTIGGVVGLSGLNYPSLRVRFKLSAPSTSVTPTVAWASLGQRAGDTFVGAGVSRSTTNFVDLPGGGKTLPVDGFNFSKLASNPVLSPTSSTWYSAAVSMPDVIPVGSDYWMYFSGWNGSNNQSIGRAVSSDLVNWTIDAQPVLSGTASTWDAGHVGWPRVLPDPSSSGYVMYYEAWNGTGRGRVGRATSSDGQNWTKDANNPVLVPSASGWDSVTVGPVVNVTYSGGNWTMWYSANSQATSASWAFDYMNMGVATSTDGVNWTRYGGNPVLSRGASYDTVAVRAGHIVLLDGTYYYYYGCHDGSDYSDCAAYSSNGYSWTKYGRVITRIPGGQENAIADLTVLVVNGALVMFYPTYWTQVKIYRADSQWKSGTSSGTVDFGSWSPSQLSAAAVSFASAAGTSMALQVRSSADGSTWSSYETVANASGAVLSTPARRYLNWLVTESANARASPPVFAGVSVDYLTYASTGRYESNDFAYAGTVAAVGAALNLTGSAGSVTVDVSTDAGGNWTRVPSASLTTLASNSTTLRYALNLEGTTNTTPVVDTVRLTVQHRGLPQDVTVRLGANGTAFFNATGVFNQAVNVSLPVAALNAAIAAARAQFPSATSVDVPLFVTTSHFGTVEIREPRVTFALKNPLSAAFAPSSPSVAIYENNTTTFGASYTVFPVGLKVNISWYLDGVEVAGTRDALNYTFAADFFSAGTYAVRCFVENGDFFFNGSWDLTVYNVNRPPVFTLVSPASPVTMSHSATVTFTAQSADPDLEPIAFLWRLDGRYFDSGVDAVNLTGLALGSHLLQVRVADGTAAIVANWTVVSTNDAPLIVSVTPPGNVSLSHFAALTLSVLASDGDADPLGYIWRLDGVVLLNGTAAALALDNLTLGVHFVALAVSDPFTAASFAWALTSTNEAPDLASFDPPGDFSLSHTASRSLTAAATDADGEPLTFLWTLDGAPLEAAGPLTSIGPLALGGHSVRLRVADAYESAEFTWAVTSTNAAPVFVVVAAPAGGQARSHTETVRLEVSASDLDGDAVALAWTVNGVAAASVTGILVLSPVGLGLATVILHADDGLTSSAWTWSTNGTNAAPSIAPFGPSTNLTVSFADATAFSAGATDPDGDALTWRWSLDGALLDTGNTTFTVAPQPLGRHEVLLVVSDGLLDAQVFAEVSSVDLPPSFLAIDPVANFTFSHTGARTVRVEAFDHEGATLTYAWHLDSLLLPETGNATGLRSLPPGTFLLRLDVSDGANTITRQWAVQVTDGAPVVSGLSPTPGAVSVNTFTDITFTARATDADGDPVALAWFDGNVPLNGSEAVTLRWTTGGTHPITLEVLSGGVRLTYTWSVAVTSLNRPPSISLAEPNSSIVLAVLAERVGFAVGIDDDGLLPVNATWFLDGVAVGQGTGFVFVPKSENLGTHNLTVRVSDGEYSTEQSWQLEIVSQRPVQQTGGGEGTLLLVALLVAAAGLAAFVQMRRRRK